MKELLSLPIEILGEILFFLDPQSLVQLGIVCKFFQKKNSKLNNLSLIEYCARFHCLRMSKPFFGSWTQTLFRKPKIYFCDREKGNISCVNFDGTNLKCIVSNLMHPKGIQVLLKYNKIIWSEKDQICYCNLNGENVNTLISSLGGGYLGNISFF